MPFNKNAKVFDKEADNVYGIVIIAKHHVYIHGLDRTMVPWCPACCDWFSSIKAQLANWWRGIKAILLGQVSFGSPPISGLAQDNIYTTGASHITTWLPRPESPCLLLFSFLTQLWYLKEIIWTNYIPLLISINLSWNVSLSVMCQHDIPSCSCRTYCSKYVNEYHCERATCNASLVWCYNYRLIQGKPGNIGSRI